MWLCPFLAIFACPLSLFYASFHSVIKGLCSGVALLVAFLFGLLVLVLQPSSGSLLLFFFRGF